MTAALAIRAFIASWWRAGAGFVLATALCLPLGYCKGQSAERAEWQAAGAAIKLNVEQLARAADRLAVQRQTAAAATIATDRKEVDDALSGIPDQALSARQRARACVELRRQAPPGRLPDPAC